MDYFRCRAASILGVHFYTTPQKLENLEAYWVALKIYLKIEPKLDC